LDYKKLNHTDWPKFTQSEELGKYVAINMSGVDAGDDSEIFLFVNNTGYHLIIRNLDNIKSFDELSINGLELSLKKYKIENQMIDFIDIRLKNKIYLQQYTIIVKEICDKLFVEGAKPEKAIKDILGRWRVFWALTPKEELSDEKQLGLFCELKFLLNLIINGFSDVLNTWKGPSGYKHDFLLKDKAFEIKGTFKGNHTHSINGIDQLKRPVGMNLYLVSYITIKHDGSVNLQMMVETIEESFQNNPQEFEKFHRLLKKTGYNRLHSDKYRNLGIKIVEQNCYEVNENFPRLTSSYLNTNISERVTKISYTINLDGISTIPLNDTIK